PVSMFAKITLYFFGILYVLLGVWCAAAPEKTSKAIGFTLNNSSGFAEYMTVYGGLEVGLGLFFLFCATRDDLRLAGVYLAFISSFCLFSFRSLSFYLKSDFEPITIITFCVEISLTILGGLALKFYK
ncbi:DUF4345 family protein, partial [Staphylococcus epidermidis]